jgi:hypothetical protein
LGYDWLFYDLNRSDRELIRNSIVQKGLNPGLHALSEDINSIESNQMLIISSGLVLGGLAVADDFPDLNKKVIHRFLVNNQQTLQDLTFSKIREKYEGNWNENAGDLAMVLSSLNISLGHDFKITMLENIKSFSLEYLDFLENDTHPDQEKKSYILNPAILWFGKLNSNQEATDFYMDSVKKYHIDASPKTQLNYVCLLWMI